MDKEFRNMVIMIAAVFVIVAAGWFLISSSSGVNPPFTVIESHSMQHCSADDRHSEVGVIDTGDLILVKSTDKCDIVTYVEGSQTGYETFGDYGNVIVYKRDARNPVIHRAFIWLEHNSDDTWSAPSLEHYTRGWSCTDTTDYNHLTGKLTFTNVGNVVPGGKTLQIDLSTITPVSGYLTVGDSVSNLYFDQTTSISSGPVTEDIIKSVAWKEIPWLGSVKLMLNGRSAELDSWASNSKIMLAELVVAIVAIVIAIGYIIDEITYIRKRDESS